MKRFFYIIAFLALTTFAFAEKITASKQGGASSIPIEYEYFVKKGDKIRMRRISAQGMSECELTVESLDWNRAEFSF